MDIIGLYAATFTASEGAEEGALIGNLARKLLADTAPDDIFVFTAKEDGASLKGPSCCVPALSDPVFW